MTIGSKYAKNTVINIGSARVLPQQWLKVGRGAAKYHLKKKKIKGPVKLVITSYLMAFQTLANKCQLLVSIIKSIKKSQNIMAKIVVTGLSGFSISAFLV